MGSKAAAYDHGPVFFRIPETAAAPRIKELILGRHNAAKNREPDGAAVEVSRKGKIRSPVCVLRKEAGGMR